MDEKRVLILRNALSVMQHKVFVIDVMGGNKMTNFFYSRCFLGFIMFCLGWCLLTSSCAQDDPCARVSFKDMSDIVLTPQHSGWNHQQCEYCHVLPYLHQHVCVSSEATIEFAQTQVKEFGTDKCVDCHGSNSE